MPTTTTFALSITLASDAMQTPDDAARALRDLATRLDGRYDWNEDRGTIRDWNGNTVGEWSVDAVTHDA